MENQMIFTRSDLVNWREIIVQFRALFPHLLSRFRCSSPRPRPRPRLWVPGPRLISPKHKSTTPELIGSKNHYSRNRVMCSHENDDLLIKIYCSVVIIQW